MLQTWPSKVVIAGRAKPERFALPAIQWWPAILDARVKPEHDNLSEARIQSVKPSVQGY